MTAFVLQNLFRFLNCFEHTFLISLISYLYCAVETSDAKISLPVWISRHSSVFIIYYVKIKAFALVLLIQGFG